MVTCALVPPQRIRAALASERAARCGPRGTATRVRELRGRRAFPTGSRRHRSAPGPDADWRPTRVRVDRVGRLDGLLRVGSLLLAAGGCRLAVAALRLPLGFTLLAIGLGLRLLRLGLLLAL